MSILAEVLHPPYRYDSRSRTDCEVCGVPRFARARWIKLPCGGRLQVWLGEVCHLEGETIEVPERLREHWHLSVWSEGPNSVPVHDFNDRIATSEIDAQRLADTWFRPKLRSVQLNAGLLEITFPMRIVRAIRCRLGGHPQLGDVDGQTK